MFELGRNICTREYVHGQHHISALKKRSLMLAKHAQPVTHASMCSLAGQSRLIPLYRSDKQLTQARNAGHEYIRYPPLPPPRTTKRKNRAINGRSSHTSLQAARRHLQFASFPQDNWWFWKTETLWDVQNQIMSVWQSTGIESGYDSADDE